MVNLVRFIFCTCLLFFLLPVHSYAQQKKYKCVSAADSLLVEQSIKNQISLYRSKGYWDVSYTQSFVKNKAVVIYNKGPKYVWTKVEFVGLDNNLSLAKEWNNKQWFNSEINPEPFFRKILNYYDQNGHPYASIFFQDVRINSNRISAQILLDEGPRVTIDSINLKGNVKLAPSYLYGYLGLRPGKVFNGQRFKMADRLLRDLPFIELTQPTETWLTDSSAHLNIYAKKLNTSYFSGILGFQPGSGVNGRLQLTGDVSLKLWNILDHGEQIQLEWKRIANGTQSAHAYLMYPYIVGTPLAVWGEFDLFRRDTSFQTIEYGAGFDYLWYGNNKLRLGYIRQQSRLIERAAYIASKSLPPDMDVDWDKLNIAFDFGRYDYRLNPTKGFKILVQFQPGIRRIRPITELPDSLYKDFDLRSFQSYAYLEWEQYIRLSPKWTFYYQSKWAYQYSKSRFYNDLLRIGGNNSLRGFDEASIYTNGYAIANTEIRFLFDRNSNVFVFANGGFAEQALHSGYEANWLYGFGAGLRFGTKAGILNLAYGLGAKNREPIKFANSKIHLGFTGVF